MASAPPYYPKSQLPYPTGLNLEALPPPGQLHAYPPQSPPYPGPPPPGTAYYPPVQPVQQQQSAAAGATSAPILIVQAPPVESYGGYIAFACIVFWCCNWLFGLIAFILASKYTVQLFYFILFYFNLFNYACRN
jgi:hypothetical protein